MHKPISCKQKFLAMKWISIALEKIEVAESPLRNGNGIMLPSYFAAIIENRDAGVVDS